MPQDLIKVKKYQGVYYRVSSKLDENERPVKRFQGKADRCFYITYRDGSGKFIREKVGWASEGYNAQNAVHVRGERMRAVRHGDELPDRKSKNGDPTLHDVWKHYDKWLDTGKKHTYQDRNRYKNHIKKKFGRKQLSQITSLDLEEFKDSLIKKGLSHATVKHVLVIIRQLYNKARAWNLWSGENPMNGVKMPVLNNRRVRFLTHEEAHILLDALSKYEYNQGLYEISLISIHSGLRAGEIFGLLWGYLNFENNIIHVADTKGKPSHDAYMTKTVRKMLLSKKKGKPSDLIFKDYKGRKLKEIGKPFAKIINDLGFNEGITDRRQRVSFHTLRHTFASWLAIQGTPILEIKELLGHKTLAMTERYAHLIPDQKRNSVARMEKAFIEHQPSPES